MIQATTMASTKKGIQYDASGFEQARGVEVIFIAGDATTCDMVTVGAATLRADELSFESGVLVGNGWTVRSSDWE